MTINVAFTPSETSIIQRNNASVIALVGFTGELSEQGYDAILIEDLLKSHTVDSPITFVVRSSAMHLSKHDPSEGDVHHTAAISVCFEAMKAFTNSRLVVYVSSEKTQDCLEENADCLATLNTHLQEWCLRKTQNRSLCSTRVSIQYDDKDFSLHELATIVNKQNIANHRSVKTLSQSKCYELLRTASMVRLAAQSSREPIALVYIIGGDRTNSIVSIMEMLGLSVPVDVRLLMISPDQRQRDDVDSADKFSLRNGLMEQRYSSDKDYDSYRPSSSDYNEHRLFSRPSSPRREDRYRREDRFEARPSSSPRREDRFEARPSSPRRRDEIRFPESNVVPQEVDSYDSTDETPASPVISNYLHNQQQSEF